MIVQMDPIERIMEQNPDLQWDDIHDVRAIAEKLSEEVDKLEEENHRLKEYINKR